MNAFDTDRLPRRSLLAAVLALMASCWVLDPSETPHAEAAEKDGTPAAKEAREGDEGAEREETWHEIRLGERPAGWSMTRHTRLEDGGYETLSRTRMRIKRGELVLDLDSFTRVRENADGSVRDFETEQEQSEVRMRFQGRVEGKKLRVENVTSEKGDDDSLVQELPYDPRALGPYALVEQSRKKLEKEGDRLELVAFLADQLRAAKMTMNAGALEEIEIGGKTRSLRRIDTVLEPGMRLISWVDGRFDAQRVSLPMLGMELVLDLSTREAVLAADLSSPPEVFLASAVPLRGKLPPRPSSAKFRLRPLADTGALELPRVDAAGQEFASEPDGSWIISTRALRGTEGTSIAQIDRGAMAPYLRATPLLAIKAPRLVAAARKAIGDETDSTRAARKLEAFVHRTVRTKNLGTAFAGALEVLDRKEGDCTEHAVLLAALARAVGIPSRGVVGLVRHGDGMFGHMWTELYTGAWIPYDATIASGEVAADRIALGVSSLDAKTSSELFLPLLPVFGQVKVEVLSSQ